MHADGNIQYANYQSEAQMSDYLTSNGFESVISSIILVSVSYTHLFISLRLFGY